MRQQADESAVYMEVFRRCSELAGRDEEIVVAFNHVHGYWTATGPIKRPRRHDRYWTGKGDTVVDALLNLLRDIRNLTGRGSKG